MHIGLDRKTRARQQSAQRCDITAFKPQAVGELEPTRDAAVTFALTIMIDQPRAPFAAHGGIFAARDQARVLDRDHRLIVVAIERPGLHLALAALAAMQQRVKRMQAVITPRADVAQRGFKLVRRKAASQHDLHTILGNLPPAVLNLAALGRAIDQDRIGVVDMDENLAAPTGRRARKEPSSPSIGMWPMRRPVFCPVCVRIISSSVNNVPSNRTHPRGASARALPASTAAAPGTKHQAAARRGDFDADIGRRFRSPVAAPRLRARVALCPAP